MRVRAADAPSGKNRASTSRIFTFHSLPRSATPSRLSVRCSYPGTRYVYVFYTFILTYVKSVRNNAWCRKPRPSPAHSLPRNAGHACDALAPLTFYITSAVGHSKSREYKRRKMRKLLRAALSGTVLTVQTTRRPTAVYVGIKFLPTYYPVRRRRVPGRRAVVAKASRLSAGTIESFAVML